jgi:hypothetical protein
MMRDEKLVAVAIRSKQPVERVVWVWGAILESAAEIDDVGRFELDAAEAAYFLRTDEIDIQSILDALTNAGRLAADRVVKWGDRQYQSDKSAERQARYRERRRSKNAGSDDQQTPSDVTQPSRDGVVTLQETETETEITEPSGSDAASPVDPRQQLWSEGVSILKAITGKTDGAARQIVGKWCKAASDDCALILSKIRTAQAERVGDPVSWITAAVKPPDDPPPKARNAGQLARQQLQAMRDDNAPSTHARYLDHSDREPGFAGTGIARQFAITAGR